MNLTEALLVLAAILILVDVFFLADLPTFGAYILITTAISKNFDIHVLYKILFGIIIFFTLIIFHYLIWRKLIEKINDEFIVTQKHKGGHEGLVGQNARIQEINGRLVAVVGDEVYQFKSIDPVMAGDIKIIKKVDSSTLIID
jgi:membrane protein implicated in regulation of membrane protease activity